MTVQPAAPALSATGIRLRFGGITALDGISFTVGNGELVALIGPNGAGKTCVLNVASGVYRPQEGDVRLGETSLLGMRPDRIADLGIARTFQHAGLFGRLTVRDTLLLGAQPHLRHGVVAAMTRSRRTRRQEQAQRSAVDDLLAFLGLRAYRDTPVGLLPYGLAKRVELGRALALQPRLLLLDEPVAGMNPAERADLAAILKAVRRDLGLTAVLIEHDLRLVAAVADRVVALDFGRVIAEGTPGQVRRDPRVVEAYLGAPHRSAS